ncbi:Xylose isomerase-like TIM barrel [Planctomycetes bacterium Poly30]|uniref:Xylose isomerase-like TIM barrel n=1 Tax=Saltatorellus ferox TaxID=2528018 RepID=A0A518EQH5_9BACT|nr:Xylose isomerase-like TIM barrel [Planctomycetes bacterium Poly30]
MTLPASALSRRHFVTGTAGLLAAGIGGEIGAAANSLLDTGERLRHAPSMNSKDDPWFKISLAEWSLHRTLRKPTNEGGIRNLDFPSVAKAQFGCDGIEYVNAFFRSPNASGEDVARGTDFGYLEELRAACTDAGVQSLLIMVDGEGQLADADDAHRRDAVENHFKWVAAAAYLGCHSIRVNAGGQGERDEMAARAADSLRRIARVSDAYDINVIVENHGGLSSDGAWLADVMKRADHPRVGTLPDFGNFYDYDRYQGVADLMPYAKAVSAKTHDFDASGNETKTDYKRMLQIVQDAGYRGWVGIEYEGGNGDEAAGILATKALLERVRAELG